MIALLLACAHAPDPAPAAPPVPQAAPMSQHPGTITFVDPDGGTRERPAAELPEAIAWYGAGAARVPVVRVVATDAGGTLEIKRYGPDGALLDVTMGARP